METKWIKIAEWLREDKSYVSRLINKKYPMRPSVYKAIKLKGLTGISVEDWLTQDKDELKQRLQASFIVRNNRGEA